MAILQTMLLELERAQGRRNLTSEELEFKKSIKSKLVGMAVIQKSKAKQHSRLTWIRHGDTNSRLFHICANARRKQNFISAIQDGDRIAVSQSDKDNVAFQFFSQSIGTPKPRSLALNWEALGYEQFDLDSLDSPFTEQEISLVIKEMPSMKAPGPDGFIGLFYKKCWNVIKYDLMEAVQAFYNHRTSKLNLLNEANIILLRKKQEASSMADYRPISLINSVVKIITKILASRLAPKLDNVVSNAQNAFIRKRCIHGNFIYAQKVIQTLHKKNNPAFSSSWTSPRPLILLVGPIYWKYYRH